MKIKTPKFGKDGNRFWRTVLSEYELTLAHDLERLTMASKCLDNLADAEKRIKKDGLFLLNRYGNVIEHPAMKTIKDMRLLFVKIIREMGLDLDTVESRPPRQY